LPQDLTYVIETPADVQELWDVIEHSSGTLNITTLGTYFRVDASSGSLPVNLPAAANNRKRVINIKKVDSSSNTITVDPNGSETIDGSSTVTITAQWANLTIISDGSNWLIV
jgi:hypothetical protein